MDARRQWALNRKKALEDELRELDKQRAQVQQRINELSGGGLAAGQAPRLGAGPGTLSSVPSKGGRKRPAGHPGAVAVRPEPDLTPAAKRQRLEVDRQKRVNALWGQCATQLKNLSKNKDAHYFLKPVDPVALKCPDYFDIVKKPMSLDIIQNRLGSANGANRKYRNVQDFVSDVRQIWANCRAYNGETHPVRLAGERMSDNWEKKWQHSDLEAKFAQEELIQKAEDNGQDWGANGHAEPSLPARMDEMNTELQELQQRIPAKAGAQKEGVSWADKRRLSIAIGNLSGDKIAQVMSIISCGASGQKLAEDNGEGEVELELDDLDDATLKALQRYIEKQAAQATATAAAKAKATAEQNKQPAGQPQEGAQAAASRPQGHEGAGASSAARPAEPNGAAAPAGPAPTPHPAAPAQPDGASPSSSSSSSGSDSSDTGSDDEAVSRRENVGDTSTFHQGGQQDAGHGEVTTLVSGTGNRSDPSGIFKNASKMERTVEVDVDAWANLDDKDPAEEAAPADGPQDDLWQEFRSRDQVANDKAQEEKALKDQEQAQKQAEKQKAEAEVKRKADEAEAARKEAEAAKERDKQAKIEEQRQRELAQLQRTAKDEEGAGPDGREHDLLKMPHRANNAMMHLKPVDDDDGSSSDDDDDAGTEPGNGPSSQGASAAEEDDGEEEGEL
ncbi:hypothetical protein WJX74_005950 [Apatococcus lobatus]|uniref:Uncharacterized protein n=1 Tax=Apatococcus lobatus TaxID=904363 RepID=A0AAW1S2B4_9CHLO